MDVAHEAYHLIFGPPATAGVLVTGPWRRRQSVELAPMPFRMALGFPTAWPVNWWLVCAGLNVRM